MADATRWKATIVVEFYKEGFYNADEYLMERTAPLKDIMVWRRSAAGAAGGPLSGCSTNRLADGPALGPALRSALLPIG